MASPPRRNCRVFRSRGLWPPAEKYSEGRLVRHEHNGRHDGWCARHHEATRRARGQFRIPRMNVTILATLSTPKNATGPVPVVLMFGGGGAAPEGVPATTPCVVPGTGAPARGAAAPAATAAGAGRGAAPVNPNAPPSAQEQIVMRGWGYASVATGSIQADNGQGLTCGIIGLVNKGQPRKLDDWGVLSA